MNTITESPVVKNVNQVGDDFDFRLKAFLESVRTTVLTQVNDEWQKKFGRDYCRLEVDDSNKSKFIRIWSVNENQRSAWAFVAKTDGESKALGTWKAGDILKCATWRAPAKHARGNIFDTANGPTCNVKRWTGPDYL